MEMEKKRITLALLLAPLAAPLLYYLWMLFIGPAEFPTLLDLVISFSVVLIFAAPVSYVSTIVLGMPALYLLRRYGVLSLFSLTVVGIILGLAIKNNTLTLTK